MPFLAVAVTVSFNSSNTTRHLSENIIVLLCEPPIKRCYLFSFTSRYRNFPSQSPCRAVSHFKTGCQIVGGRADRTAGSKVRTNIKPSSMSPCKKAGGWVARPAQMWSGGQDPPTPGSRVLALAVFSKIQQTSCRVCLIGTEN